MYSDTRRTDVQVVQLCWLNLWFKRQLCVAANIYIYKYITQFSAEIHVHSDISRAEVQVIQLCMLNYWFKRTLCVVSIKFCGFKFNLMTVTEHHQSWSWHCKTTWTEGDDETKTEQKYYPFTDSIENFSSKHKIMVKNTFSATISFIYYWGLVWSRAVRC